MASSTSFIIPIRWIISILGIYACALVYAQRASMSVAIVAMTRTTTNTDITQQQSKYSQTRTLRIKTHECADEVDVVNDNDNEPIWTTKAYSYVNHSTNTFSNNYVYHDHKVIAPEFQWNEKLQVCKFFFQHSV